MCAGSATTGSGLPAPNGPACAMVAIVSAVAAAAVSAPSILQRIVAPRRRDRVAERLFEESAERRQRVLAQRDARRHGMAAALDQQPLAHRLPHDAAEIDAGDRAARAGADAAGLERNREGRPAEPLLQPRRHEPDHARMPAFGGGDHRRALLLDAERRHGLGFRLRDASPPRWRGARC